MIESHIIAGRGRHKTLGVTAANEKILTALAAEGRFITDIKAVKFAKTYASTMPFHAARQRVLARSGMLGASTMRGRAER